MRLIDADKLIEDIESYRGDIFVNEIVELIKEVPTIGEWIPCSERMPEEYESIFAKFKGTDQWKGAMFEKISDNVNVTVEFEDGTRKTMKGYTVDGKWKLDTAVKCKVVAWQPLPDPYQPEGESHE